MCGDSHLVLKVFLMSLLLSLRVCATYTHNSHHTPHKRTKEDPGAQQEPAALVCESLAL